MTKDDILSMKPGPELNTLMATKVMCWKRMACDDYFRMETGKESKARFNHVLTNYWHDSEGKECANAVDDDGDYYACGCGCNDAWSPSTNIADAWPIMEWLVQDEYEPQLISGESWDETWTIGIPITDEPFCRIQGKTAPEAICKAALIAVLGDVE